MTKTEMLTKIYEVIADKSLSFGCKVIMRDTDIKYGTNICCPDWLAYYHNDGRWWFEFDKSKLVEIIGHPIMLGNILDWSGRDRWYGVDFDQQGHFEYEGDLDRLLWLWLYKCQSIDQQSDECIKYVYDLLPPSSSNEQ